MSEKETELPSVDEDLIKLQNTDIKFPEIVEEDKKPDRFHRYIGEFEIGDFLVRPKMFEYKKSKIRSYGFLPDDVAESYPTLENILWFKSKTREGGPVKVDETRLIPILWNKILEMDNQLTLVKRTISDRGW